MLADVRMIAGTLIDNLNVHTWKSCSGMLLQQKRQKQKYGKDRYLKGVRTSS